MNIWVKLVQVQLRSFTSFWFIFLADGEIRYRLQGLPGLPGHYRGSIEPGT